MYCLDLSEQRYSYITIARKNRKLPKIFEGGMYKQPHPKRGHPLPPPLHYCYQKKNSLTIAMHKCSILSMHYFNQTSITFLSGIALNKLMFTDVDCCASSQPKTNALRFATDAITCSRLDSSDNSAILY